MVHTQLEDEQNNNSEENNNYIVYIDEEKHYLLDTSRGNLIEKFLRRDSISFLEYLFKILLSSFLSLSFSFSNFFKFFSLNNNNNITQRKLN